MAPKVVYTKDGITKIVTSSSGKQKIFQPIEVKHGPSEDEKIEALAEKLADQMLQKLLANMPEKTVIIQQGTSSSTSQPDHIAMDEKLVVVESNISDLQEQNADTKLVETKSTSDSSFKASKSKLAKLKKGS